MEKMLVDWNSSITLAIHLDRKGAKWLLKQPTYYLSKVNDVPPPSSPSVFLWQKENNG